MICTSCALQQDDANVVCSGCGMAVAGAAAAPLSRMLPGGGTDAGAIPDGVKGWSWGAFLLNWIWAIGNRTWIGLLALIPYVGVLVAIWLGIKGREMAWKNASWDSLEHFNRVQRRWSIWALVLTFGMAGLGIFAAIAIPAYQAYTVKARQHAQAGEPALQAFRPDGTIDSNATDLPATIDTVAGTLARNTARPAQRFVTLDGKALFKGDDANWQFPLRAFTLSQGREAILMASSGGRGTSCETRFFFLLAEAGQVRATPHFGSCAAQAEFAQRGDAITVVTPKPGGTSTVVLAGGVLSEDGRSVELNDLNDPAK